MPGDESEKANKLTGFTLESCSGVAGTGQRAGVSGPAGW